MKKIISITAALVLCLSALVGCMNQSPSSGAAGSTAADAAVTEPAGTETEPTATEKETETEEQTAPDTDAKTEEETEAETSAEVVTDAPAPPAEYNFNDFDADLMDYVASKVDGNFMISPLSFKYALGMLIAGADGNTLTELMAAVGMRDMSELEEQIKDFNHFTEGFAANFEQELSDYREGVKKGWYNKDDPEPVRALRVADSVWKNSDIAEDFKDDYKLHLEMYDAEYRNFDLDSVIKEVNKWADEKTEGMIPRLLPDDYDTTYLAVILMNALYFKDDWAVEFSECVPFEDDFTTSDGATVKKTYMIKPVYCRYYKDDVTELAVIPMKGNIEMVFVLGDTNGIAEKIKKAENRKVLVTIPAFETETTLDKRELCDFLAARGVKDVFSIEKADLSKMIDIDNLYVSDIVQKTKIKLDKNGVEAAAVTAIMINDYGIEQTDNLPVFTADKAFSYYIMTGESEWSNSSGTVLFEGKLVK